MVITRTRRRLVNFRLTEQEYRELQEACLKYGARSVSEFARHAVLVSMDSPVAPGTGELGLASLHETIVKLESRLRDLGSQVEQTLALGEPRRRRDAGRPPN